MYGLCLSPTPESTAKNTVREVQDRETDGDRPNHRKNRGCVCHDLVCGRSNDRKKFCFHVVVFFGL